MHINIYWPATFAIFWPGNSSSSYPLYLPEWINFFSKTSPKVQSPNGRAHGVEELLFQGSATAELHEGHAE